MITVIITSYKEPKSTVRAASIFLEQLKKQKQKFKIIVADPFPEVGEYLKKEIKDKNVEFFLDPGEGKSYVLNILLQELYHNNKEDIIFFSDGDVYVSENSVSEIMKLFNDREIGCVTAKPVSTDSRNTKYGYWSHLLFSGIDKVRKKLSHEKFFFECSGYFFAIRNGVVNEFPIEASEDAVIPYLFWKKGFKIAYADKALVYVKNPANWKDWKIQKIRNIKGHENLSRIFKDIPRTKTFFNEIKEGFLFSLFFSRNLKEALWTIELYFARLYIYIKAFIDLKRKKSYSDGWRVEETESTKPMD